MIQIHRNMQKLKTLGEWRSKRADGGNSADGGTQEM